jgi:hypothetical protein
MTDIYKFNKYYSIPFMKRFFSVLALRGFIIPDKPGTFHTLYKLSDSAITLITEIDQYYSKELYEFSNRYNIDL